MQRTVVVRPVASARGGRRGGGGGAMRHERRTLSPPPCGGVAGRRVVVRPRWAGSVGWLLNASDVATHHDCCS